MACTWCWRCSGDDAAVDGPGRRPRALEDTSSAPGTPTEIATSWDVFQTVGRDTVVVREPISTASSSSSNGAARHVFLGGLPSTSDYAEAPLGPIVHAPPREPPHAAAVSPSHPKKSPRKSPLKSPHTSPRKSPSKSPRKSPRKSPLRSPAYYHSLRGSPIRDPYWDHERDLLIEHDKSVVYSEGWICLNLSLKELLNKFEEVSHSTNSNPFALSITAR